MIYNLTVAILFIIFKSLFKFEVFGRENIPSKGAFILACNHSSYLDPPILGAGCFLKRRLNFVAKNELFQNRLFAWYIDKLGAFPIRRNFGDIKAIRESIRRIRKGRPLVIFPEGDRSADGTLKEGFPGMALLAVKTQIPIIPTYIKGADIAWGVGTKSIKFCKIVLRFGRPLFFHKEFSHDYTRITDNIMSEIKELSVIV